MPTKGRKQAPNANMREQALAGSNMGASFRCLFLLIGVTVIFIIYLMVQTLPFKMTMYMRIFPQLLQKRYNITDFTEDRNRSTAGIACINSIEERMFSRLETCIKARTLENDKNTSGCNRNNSFACTHFMTVKSYGRSGNHMFQVAMLLGTAYHYGYTAVIHPSMDITNWFNLPNIAAMTFDNVILFQERNWGTYDPRITNLSKRYNYTFQAFFQSWRYFNEVEEILRHAFTFKQDILNKATEFIRYVGYKYQTKICIHIRRTDFLRKPMKGLGYEVAPLQYITQAMEHFRRKYKYMYVQFIVLSDDKNWCKLNVNQQNVTFSPFTSAEIDLAVMSLCNDVIITSGTFGWWGGWLSGGEVVYWNGFPRQGSTLFKHFNHTDYYPRHWIGLD